MDETDYMQSIQRDDPSVDSAGLVAAYERGIDDLKSAVAGMTPEQLRARPIPGKWSTIEVVAHVADAELYFSDRIERTLALDRPLLMGVDERPYVERLGYQSFDLDEELALVSSLRRRIARILRSQPTDAWQRQGVHSETGLVTVRQLVFHAVRHVTHHVPFIAEKRAALRT
jgi:uncharacterized damage-inducible protein DinB